MTKQRNEEPVFLFLMDESWFTQLIGSTLHIHSYGVYIEKINGTN